MQMFIDKIKDLERELYRKEQKFENFNKNQISNEEK